METSIKSILEYALRIVQGMFAEASIFLFVFGLIIFLIGLAFLVLVVYVRIVGVRVEGRVLGAIKESYLKEKVRDGKTIKVPQETLYAIFEYPRANGSLHQEKASEGGSAVLKYSTGQTVNLLVVPDDGYDDVYDADKKSDYIIGAVLFLVGVMLMYHAASLYASLSMSAFALFIIVISLLIKGFSRKKHKSKPSAQAKHFKHYDLESIRPIEEFKN